MKSVAKVCMEKKRKRTKNERMEGKQEMGREKGESCQSLEYTSIYARGTDEERDRRHAGGHTHSRRVRWLLADREKKDFAATDRFFIESKIQNNGKGDSGLFFCFARGRIGAHGRETRRTQAGDDVVPERTCRHVELLKSRRSCIRFLVLSSYARVCVGMRVNRRSQMKTQQKLCGRKARRSCDVSDKLALP